MDGRIDRRTDGRDGPLCKIYIHSMRYATCPNLIDLCRIKLRLQALFFSIS